MLGDPTKKRELATCNQTLESLQEYAYLGQIFSGNLSHEKEIHQSIQMVWRTYDKHSQIMTGNLQLSLRQKVHNNCILPVLIYGMET